MGKIAFVFSGQGDQFPGMGHDLYEKYPAAQRIYELCDSIRPGTSEQCFNGTDEELRETRNTQPCLFATELAIAGVLIKKGIIPEATAGFSLGELTAAVVSGVFDKETGFLLVCKRGELMQAEAEKHDTSMAAIVKLTGEQVKEACSKYTDIYPVNYNCPGQITVAGLSSQMSDFIADIKTIGGRAVPLKVRAAFHSPFMNNAAKAFARELKTANIREQSIPLYSDLTAEPYGKDVIGQLSGQICNPVHWEKLVRNMLRDGVDTFIEIGPGRTLTNMIKKINADAEAVSASEYLAEAEV